MAIAGREPRHPLSAVHHCPGTVGPPHRPPEDQVRTAGSRNGDPGLPRLLAPAAGVQRALCAQLLTELGESCKRLPSQTPPRTGPQPPSLRPPSAAGVVLAFTAAPMKF